MGNSGTRVVITADTAQAQAAVRSFGQELTGLTGKFSSLAGMAGTLGGALSLTAFAGFIKSGIDAADQLHDLAQKTGSSVEALAGLKFAADQNGTSLEALAQAGKKLSATMADKPALFARFGITAQDTTGALVQLADIFASMPDGVQKTALAVKLMGKGAEEMIPFLNQGGAALRALVTEGQRLNPVTTEMAQQADRFNDDLVRLRGEAGSAGIILANKLLPSLADTATAMADAAREGNTLYAVLRGIAGIGKLPFDLYLGDAGKNDLSSTARIAELKGELLALAQNREQVQNGGLLQRWLYGTTDEIDKKIEVTSNLLATLQNHGWKLDRNKEIQASQEQLRKELAQKSGAGQQLYEALGGDGDKKKPYKLPFDPEDDFWSAVGEARSKRLKKEQVEDEERQAEMARNIEEAERGRQERMADIAADIAAAQEKEAKRGQEAWVRFTENVQHNLGDVLYNGLQGKFDGIGDMFKNMLLRMSADAMAAQLTRSLFGADGGGGWLGSAISMGASFFGGSSGPVGGLAGMDQSLPIMANARGNVFSGAGIGAYSGQIVDRPTLFPFARGIGLMGEAGPEAIMPLRRDSSGRLGVSGGGTTLNITSAPVINIDSRADRADIMRMVGNAVQQGNAMLVDQLQRQGALA